MSASKRYQLIQVDGPGSCDEAYFRRQRIARQRIEANDHDLSHLKEERRNVVAPISLDDILGGHALSMEAIQASRNLSNLNQA